MPGGALFADPVSLGLAGFVFSALLGLAPCFLEGGGVRIDRGGGDGRRGGDFWLARSWSKAAAKSSGAVGSVRGFGGFLCSGTLCGSQGESECILFCFLDALELFLAFSLAGVCVCASFLVVPREVFAVLPPADGRAQTMAEVVLAVLVLCTWM